MLLDAHVRPWELEEFRDGELEELAREHKRRELHRSL